MQVTIFNELDTQKVEKFEKYHKKYPNVYTTFKKLALESKKIGHKRFSARGLFQVMRWKMGGDIKSDNFKYNNNYTPYYVRLLEKELPEFIGFFEKRNIKSENYISNH